MCVRKVSIYLHVRINYLVREAGKGLGFFERRSRRLGRNVYALSLGSRPSPSLSLSLSLSSPKSKSKPKRIGERVGKRTESWPRRGSPPVSPNSFSSVRIVPGRPTFRFTSTNFDEETVLLIISRGTVLISSPRRSFNGH